MTGTEVHVREQLDDDNESESEGSEAGSDIVSSDFKQKVRLLLVAVLCLCYHFLEFSTIWS